MITYIGKFEKKVLVRTRRPYHFFGLNFSVDDGVYNVVSTRFEEQIRNASRMMGLRLYPKSLEEARFLSDWFRNLGKVSIIHLGQIPPPHQIQRIRSVVHKVSTNDSPCEVYVYFTVTSDKAEMLIRSFKELSKVGYKTAYLMGSDKYIIK